MMAASTPPFTVLGLDIGGTKTAGGIVLFPEGRIIAERTLPTLPQRGPEALLDDVVELSRGLVKESGAKVAGIGVGICELVSPEGRLLSSNCIDWRNLPVCEQLGAIAPARFEADVRAAARAEALFGAGRLHRIFIYITVGTGISSCLVVDGQPYTGARGATGTFASTPISLECEQCHRTPSRTLEQFASGPALVARCNPHLASPVTSGEEVLALAVFDPAAAKIIQSAGEALGSSVGLLVNVLDPEAVVIGGGLGLSEGLYWTSLIESVRRHIWSEVHRDLPILRAQTGENAGILGAAAVFWKASTDQGVGETRGARRTIHRANP